MLISNISSNSDLDYKMQRRILRKVQGFIKYKELKGFPLGKYKFKGNDYAIIIEENLSKKDTYIEVHQKFIDVHYIISGSERINFNMHPQSLNQGSGNVLPHYTKNDLNAQVSLLPGDFVIIYPGEAHMARLMPKGVKGNEQVKKIIFKFESEL